MTQGEAPANAREAAERNAEAVKTGNLAQVMADVAPEALQQLMGLGTSGGLTPQSMPSISGYEIEEQTDDADGELFHVRFRFSRRERDACGSLEGGHGPVENHRRRPGFRGGV